MKGLLIALALLGGGCSKGPQESQDGEWHFSKDGHYADIFGIASKSRPKPLTKMWIVVHAFSPTLKQECSSSTLVTANGFYCLDNIHGFDIELGLRSDGVIIWR